MGRLGYVPSLLCAEFVMGRVCHVPSLLWAELSLSRFSVGVGQQRGSIYDLSPSFECYRD